MIQAIGDDQDSTEDRDAERNEVRSSHAQSLIQGAWGNVRNDFAAGREYSGEVDLLEHRRQEGQ